MVTKRRAVSISLLSMTAVCSAITLSAPTAKADECDYPAVGIGVNVLVGAGEFCDFPTEINGSHWHCEIGLFGFAGGGISGLSIGGFNIGGKSCTWRCPDNTPAPAPNPPGAWKSYMIPKPNACADHMEPAGHFSEPVRPDEGIPPESSPELPGPPELLETPQLAPGEPNP